MSCGDDYVGYPCFFFDAGAAVDRGVPSICAVLWAERVVWVVWVVWVEWVGRAKLPILPILPIATHYYP